MSKLLLYLIFSTLFLLNYTITLYYSDRQEIDSNVLKCVSFLRTEFKCTPEKQTCETTDSNVDDVVDYSKTFDKGITVSPFMLFLFI